MKIKGLTLTELLFGLAIFVVLTTIAIPSVMNTLQNHRLSSTAETLYSEIQLARQEAFKRNTTVYISFVSGANWCYGLNAGSACDCTNSSSCSLGVVTPNTSSQTTLSSTGYSNYVSFESSHGSANSSGTLVLTSNQGSNYIRLTIGKLGHVQMCSNSLSEYEAC